MYQTKDKSQTGAWNKNTGSWDTLGSEYRRAVNQGIRNREETIASGCYGNANYSAGDSTMKIKFVKVIMAVVAVAAFSMPAMAQDAKP